MNAPGGDDTRRGPGRPGVLRWFRVARWAMLSLALVLGAVLIASGSPVIGGVVVGFATFRIAVFAAVGRRRRRFATAGPARFPLRALVPRELGVAARTIGVDETALRQEFRQGRSIAEVAADHGVPVTIVVEAVTRDAGAALDAAVAEGRLIRPAGERAKAAAPQWAARFVDLHRGELRRMGR